MGSVGEEQESPLLSNFSSSDAPEKTFERTGNLWTAVAHIITGVIGAGVLSLAWSMAQLGWIAGPLCMVAFAAVTAVSSFLLCDCYRFPDPEVGPTRIRSYMYAVKIYLGDKSEMVCGIFAQESLYGCGIAYTITTAKSINQTGTGNFKVKYASSQGPGDCATMICDVYQKKQKRAGNLSVTSGIL